MPTPSACRVALSDTVAWARQQGRAIVAMESTIFSTLGLPAPHNREALQRRKKAVITRGAVPAVTTVINGVWRAGLTEGEESARAGSARGCGPNATA